jgi:(E)-4-hydroxy-3-methylbut-2-enyl-diphosphate synthase
MIRRKKTRRLMLGSVAIGGGSPVSIQSMTNTRTTDVDATVAQIVRLQDAGCDIVRAAIPDEASARALADIKTRVRIPIVADIHFDHRLALLSLESGCDGLRINPGNIRDPDRVRLVVDAALRRRAPIRVGVNMGSIDRKRYPHSAKGLVASALDHIRLLERSGFRDIKVSLKASDVLTTLEANRMMSRRRPYPIHIGITEAGTAFTGAVRSGVGCGLILAEGIGDTMRVSLSTDPVREVLAARHILRSLGLYKGGIEVISCPTCGRTDIPVERIAEEIEERTAGMRANLTVAVMGCVVNGPGEASDADIGIAGGKEGAILFRKGTIVERVAIDGLTRRLMDEIRKMAGE